MRVLRPLTLSCAAAVLASAGAASSHGSVHAHWVVRDLGTLGWQQSTAAAVNSRGQVVGRIFSEPASDVAPMTPTRAFLWERGRMHDLGTLGGDCPTSDAGAINDRGQIVGAAGGYSHCSYHDYSERAVLWQSGRVQELGAFGAGIDVNSRGDVLVAASSLAGAGYVWAKGALVALSLPRGWTFGNVVDINEHGMVVGDGESDANGVLRIHAFVWRGGRPADLGTLPGWRISHAVAANDQSTVTGNAYPSYAAELKARDLDPTARSHAVVWRNGTIHDLGTLGGISSRATAIDAAGSVVGSSLTKRGVRHAFVWREKRMRDLGTLPGRVESEAVGVNGRGDVIGNAYTPTSTGPHAVHAFVWRNGTIAGLDPLPGDRQSGAVAINTRGHVVGWSESGSGRRHAVLWTLRAD